MSEKEFPRRSQQVIRGILQHLIDHPDAKDTLEGISKWWRPKGNSEWPKEEIQKALDMLALKGWLTVRDISPPQKVYGFNKKYIKEIREYVYEGGKLWKSQQPI